MKKKLLALIAQREASLNKGDALLNAVEQRSDNPVLSTEERSQYDGYQAEVRSIDTQIATVKSQIEARTAQDILAREARALSDTTTQFRSLADPSTQNTRNNGLSRDDISTLQGFSYVKAIREMLTSGRLSGLEAEMHAEAQVEARSVGAQTEGNLSIPLKVMQLSGDSMERRAMTATGQTSVAGDQGGLAIQTNVGSIIERFYAKLQLKQMGCTVLDGLVGNVLFPRHTTDDQAVVRTEVAASAASSSPMGSITLSPRRVPVVLEISRQLSMQTSPAVEAYLRDDLAFQIAKIVDFYGINGSGSGGQPFGILNTSGISQLYAGSTIAYSGGVPTITASGVNTNANGAGLSYADIVLLQKAINVANADQGKLGFLTNPAVKAALQLTLKSAVSGQQAAFVWPDSGDSIAGYNAGVSTQVPSNLTKGASSALSALIYGNFADALMGQWGGMDMLINPYSKDDQGVIRINAWTFFDFSIRRPKSFAAILDAAA